MGYLHIDNLYKYPDIFLFKEVYALEKIHGTSAHIAWKDNAVRFFAGGVSHEQFVALFASNALVEKFTALAVPEVVVYGEAYGGKCQAMSATYGKDLKFVVFDVKINKSWLVVPQAEEVAKQLGLEFVHYAKCATEQADLDCALAAPSVQAVRNGIVGDMPREGIVLRPLVELTKNNGERIICKYKSEAFQETRTRRDIAVSQERRTALTAAQAVVDEWVTEMRLTHVLDKLPQPVGIEETGTVIKAMLEDIKREAVGEVMWSKDVERTVCSATARLFKQRIGVIGAADHVQAKVTGQS